MDPSGGGRGEVGSNRTEGGSGRKSRFMASGTGEGDGQVDWPGCAILENQSIHGGGVLEGQTGAPDGLLWSDQVPWKLLGLPHN